jgi:hypothetical protein
MSDQSPEGAGTVPRRTDRAVDVQEIVDRIRETLRCRGSAVDESDVWALFADSQLTADLAGLYATSDPAQVSLVSHRKLLGRSVVGLKRVLRTLLTPILGRQASYNTMNARVASRLCEYLATSLEQQRQMRKELDELRAAVQELRRTVHE